MQGHMLSKLREQYIGSVFSTNCPSTYALCKKKKNKKTAELRSCIMWEGKLEGWGKSLFKDTGLFLDIDQHINNISVYLQKKKIPMVPQTSQVPSGFFLFHNRSSPSSAVLTAVFNNILLTPCTFSLTVIKNSQLRAIWRIWENGKFSY